MTYSAGESASSPPLFDCDLTKIGTTKLFDLGTRVQTKTGKVFRYVKATGSLALYLVCLLDEDWNASAGVSYVAAGSGVGAIALGAPQTAALTSGQYAWVQTAGKMTVALAEDVDDGDKLYTTSTAGKLGDTSTTQSLIEGLTATAAGTAVTGYGAALGVYEICVRTAV